MDALWTDKYGFLKPRIGMDSSGNGIIYTAMFYAVVRARGQCIYDHEIPQFNALIAKCQLKPGLYARTPENTYGQQQFDDYLGLFVWCIVTENKKLAREILWYGIKHAGFYNTDGKLQGTDFLFRSVHVFLGLGVLASFPALSIPWWPFMWICSKFLNADTSKVYLDWLWFYGASLRGFKSSKLADLNSELSESLAYEMDKDNPAVIAALGV